MGTRRRLPTDREAIVKRFQIGGDCKGYIVVGLYETGEPGEVFLHLLKEGSTLSGFADAFATMLSLCLQHGASLEDICAKLAHMRFEPDGWTGDPALGRADSVVDLVARFLRSRFLDKGVSNE